jgi:hypothetical protein
MLKLPKYCNIDMDGDQNIWKKKRTTLRTRSFSSKLVVYLKGFSHISRKIKIKIGRGCRGAIPTTKKVFQFKWKMIKYDKPLQESLIIHKFFWSHSHKTLKCLWLDWKNLRPLSQNLKMQAQKLLVKCKIKCVQEMKKRLIPFN